MPGSGDFVSFFFTRGPEFCTEKLSTGRTEKISGPGGGGVVTGQIDTCITLLCLACMFVTYQSIPSLTIPGVIKCV